MAESILLSVAEVVVGSSDEVEAFKSDLIMYINSALMTLGQLGVGKDYFRITDETAVWTDFIEDEDKLASIEEYVTLKVKLAFDPPSSSAALDSLQKIIEEDEWRLTIQADPVTRGAV